MAAMQNFRKSLNGFNREDVVQYIEYINNKHNSQVNQLKTEIKNQKDELETLRARPEPDPTLEPRLEAAEQARDELQAERDAQAEQIATLEAEKADLEKELATLRETLAASKAELEAAKTQLQQAQNSLETQVKTPTVDELEAYRRAERVERLAGERVAQLYKQANQTLSNATACADDAAALLGRIADSVSEQLGEMQIVLAKSKQSIQDAAKDMGAIRPIDPEE